MVISDHDPSKSQIHSTTVRKNASSEVIHNQLAVDRQSQTLMNLKSFGILGFSFLHSLDYVKEQV